MRRFRIVLVLACFLGSLGMAWAADVTDVPESERFLESPIEVISGSTNEQSIYTHDIRRPTDLIKNEKASVGVWVPFVEPGKVTRTNQNQLTNSAKIYRNVGSTAGKFPFVVEADNKFYVYKNVKYNWKFEKSLEDSDDPHGGNVDGTSGEGVWSPFFYESKLSEEVKEFITDFAEEKVGADALSNRKVFVNRHTVPYDSGISTPLTTANSTVLQQVGMLLTYDEAVVNVTPNGPGYPEDAKGPADLGDPSNVPNFVKGTVALNTEPPASAFVARKKAEPVPAAYKDVWKLGESSAYKMVYVEDHLPAVPDESKIEKGAKDYQGSIGKYFEGDVVIDLIDNNPNAKKESPAVKANFIYNVGNNDIYKMPNPLYDPNVGNSSPFVYMFILRANKQFGPYGGVADKGKEEEWYEHHHPYWSKQPKEERNKFLRTKYSLAWDIRSLPPWQIGAMYYLAFSNGSFDGLLGYNHGQELNVAWQAGQITKENCPDFFALEEELTTLSENGNIQAQFALAATSELKKAIANPNNYGIRGDRAFKRFAGITCIPEYGSYQVDSGDLEKENPAVYQESNEIIEENNQKIEVKKIKWTIHQERLILPVHYSTAALDSSNLAAFSSKQIVNVSSSNCCGVSVSVSAVPTQSTVTIRDDQYGSKPVPEVTLSDSRSNAETAVSIPVNDDLGYGESLVVKDKKTGATQEFGAWKYNDDLDLNKNEYAIKKADGSLEKIVLPDDPNDPAQKDKVIFEDVRMMITLNAYDNIDGMTPFRGIGKTQFSVWELDDGGQPVKKEMLSYTDDQGQAKKSEVIERVNDGDPFKFSPVFRFFHIFRKPGQYKAEYKVWELSSDSPQKKERTLSFNVKVLDSKYLHQQIEGSQGRN